MEMREHVAGALHASIAQDLIVAKFRASLALRMHDEALIHLREILETMREGSGELRSLSDMVLVTSCDVAVSTKKEIVTPRDGDRAQSIAWSRGNGNGGEAEAAQMLCAYESDCRRIAEVLNETIAKDLEFIAACAKRAMMERERREEYLGQIVEIAAASLDVVRQICRHLRVLPRRLENKGPAVRGDADVETTRNIARDTGDANMPMESP
jgi:signal transduction histidine kinase